MPTFEEDLFEISDYISKDAPLNAKRFVNSLLIDIENKLSFMPLMFKNYNNNVKLYPYKNYLIFYEVIEKDKKVLLLNIVHWARDLSNINGLLK